MGSLTKINRPYVRGCSRSGRPFAEHVGPYMVVYVDYKNRLCSSNLPSRVEIKACFLEVSRVQLELVRYRKVSSIPARPGAYMYM